MLRFRLIAITGALTLLVSSGRSNVAVVIGPSVADSLVDEGMTELVHYSRRYGWHCGMRNYNHEHRETCRRAREGGYSERNGAWRRRPFGAGGRPVEN
jgi:hypothetical protein